MEYVKIGLGISFCRPFFYGLKVFVIFYRFLLPILSCLLLSFVTNAQSCGLAAVTNFSCIGSCTGEVELSIPGNMDSNDFEFTYWNGGAVVAQGKGIIELSGLCSGDYLVVGLNSKTGENCQLSFSIESLYCDPPCSCVNLEEGVPEVPGITMILGYSYPVGGLLDPTGELRVGFAGGCSGYTFELVGVRNYKTILFNGSTRLKDVPPGFYVFNIYNNSVLVGSGEYRFPAHLGGDFQPIGSLPDCQFLLRATIGFPSTGISFPNNGLLDISATNEFNNQNYYHTFVGNGTVEGNNLYKDFSLGTVVVNGSDQNGVPSLCSYFLKLDFFPSCVPSLCSSPPNVSLSYVPESVPGQGGSIRAVSDDGNILDFSWMHNGVVTSESGVISILEGVHVPDEYSLVAMDENGCLFHKTGVVLECDIQGLSIDLDLPTCQSGLCDGVIRVLGVSDDLDVVIEVDGVPNSAVMVEDLCDGAVVVVYVYDPETGCNSKVYVGELEGDEVCCEHLSFEIGGNSVFSLVSMNARVRLR